MLVVLDEAGGIGKALVDAADTLIANEESRILAIGNPDDPATEFANLCKPGSGWNVIRISAFESPNFTGEKIPESLKPLLISKTWVEEKRKTWGEASMLWTSKVLGEFPEQSVDSLIPISAIRAAHARYAEPPPVVEAIAELAGADTANEIGVDVARMGDDRSVFYRRKGWRAYLEHKHTKRDLMELVGHVVRLCRKDKPKRVKIDDTGMGGGVTDRLREMQANQNPVSPAEIEAKEALAGVEIVPINVGESPSTARADERFKNKRAEINWMMRELFMADNARIAIEPNDDLDAEATQVKYKPTSTGEIQIEAKADMKKRTKGVSPDHWDALCLAFAEPTFLGFGILEYYKREAAKMAANLPGGKPTPKLATTLAAGGVRLKAPDGTSTVYGMTGQVYVVTAGHLIVDPKDATPLLGQGFERAPV